MLKSLLKTQLKIPSSLGKLFVLGFILLSYSSCTDQGCIEADDFGEYEQQTLTIPANALSESCDYYPDRLLTDAAQGPGLRECTTQGNPQVIDENGNTYSVTTNNGCMGFENNLNIQRICVEDCREKCINGASSNSGNAEPFWIATSKKKSGQNIGVTLTPGAEIYIRAVGNVVLGGDVSEPLHTQSTNYGLQSQSNIFNPEFFDVKQSISKTITFSGKWTNGFTTYGGNVASSDPNEQIRALNGARRLASFLIPHPDGYSFDTHNATSEIGGTKGTPLFADDRLWYCEYSGADTKQSTCGTYSYANNGFPNTSDVLATSLYPVTSATQSNVLGKIGGAIRWVDDNLGENLSPSGTFIGDLANNIEKPGSADFAVRVSLEDTSANSACTNINLEYHVVSSRALDGGSSGNKVTVVQNTTIADISSFYVDLEPEDSIIFSQNSAVDGSNENCGNKIAFKTRKLHDIKIEKSGFVGFTTLAPSGSSGTCSLTGRIINSGGTRINNICDAGNPIDLGCFDNDFYEYDAFGTANSADPINNLNVPISASSPLTPYQKNWSTKFFVRKGQTIRLAPESWDASWSNGTITRKCGVGMVLKVGGIDYVTGQIDDRPAFLCRGSSTEEVFNPLCTPAGTTPQTCLAYSEKCLELDQNGNAKYPTHFCPNPTCQVSSPNPTECDNSSKSPPNNFPSITVSKCQACFNEMQAAAAQPVNLSLSVDQCYDLESYSGKVTNIPSTTGFTDTQFASPNIIKGANKLSSFNGFYGNFANFADSGTVDNANKVYRLKEPLYPSSNGRLMFLLIDNNSFDQTMISNYSNNGSSGSSYSGTNGYKIDLSGRQEFKNGEWLEAILCQETSDTSTLCSSHTVPTQLTSEPHIVVVNDPVFAGESPVSKTYYKFDPFGSISAFTNSNPIGVVPSGLAQVVPGDNFYRHAYDGSDSTHDAESDEAKALVSNLKISFKIKDADITNCDMDNPLLGQTSCTSGNCGIISDNRFYDPTGSGTTGTICLAGESPGSASTECQKQFFCASPYYNNSGQYDVLVRVKNKQSDLSNIVNSVVTPVIEIMDGTPDRTKIGQTEKMYIQIVNDSRFQAIIQIMVILMITFYGVGYLMGVSEFSQTEILMKIIKIGIIYLFIGPNGWEWFNRFFVQLFKNGTDYITFLMASAFDKSAELQNAIANNSFYDKSILFGSIDKVFGLFFNSVVQKKISALLFASVFGPIYLLLIYWGFMSYVFAVAYAVLLYLTAQIFISILFVVGPIFFIMLLFNQTKEMFDKWIGELIGLSLQQIFLLTTLAFFSMMMYEIVKLSLGYRICWDDVWTIPLGPIRIKLLSFWTVASMPPKLNLQADVANVGSPEGIPSLFSVLFIWVVGSLSRKFIEFMTGVASAIGGSMQAMQLSNGLKSMADSGFAATKNMIGAKIGISGGMESVDRFLFDSGKKADEDRKKAKDALDKDRTDRNSMVKSGNEAVEKYKKEHGKDLLALKDQSAREDALKKVRRDAMEKKGEDLGIKKDDVKRILEDKAEKFKGADLASVAANAFKDRKILSKSVTDRKVDTRLTGTQIKATSKNLSEDERTEFKKKLKSGEIQTNVGGGTKFTEAAKNLDVLGAANVALVPRTPYNALKSAAQSAYNKLTRAPKTEARTTYTTDKFIDRVIKDTPKNPEPRGDDEPGNTNA